MVRAEDFRQAFLKMSEVFEEQKEYLSELDAAMGDGDHGLSMARGFKAVAERLAAAPASSETDIGALCTTVGTVLAGSIGGATGPIFGTLFLRWGSHAKGKAAVGTAELAQMFDAALQGVQTIGKAQPGDKTMVDALAPAAQAVRAAALEGLSPREALIRAAEAARRGAEATKSMQAAKGRARYQGEKSIGHMDAGAMSLTLIVETLSQAVAD